MAITVRCRCGKAMKVRDTLAGKRIRCPGCEKPVVVPEPEYDDFDDEIIDDPYDDNPYADPPPKRPRSKSGALRSRTKKKSGTVAPLLIIGCVVGGAVIGGGLLYLFFGRARPAADAVPAIVNNAQQSEDIPAARSPDTKQPALPNDVEPQTQESSLSPPSTADNSTQNTQTPAAGTSPNPAELSAADGDVGVWVVLSDFKEQASPGSIGRTYQVNYRIVSGAPDPSRQYVVYIGASMGMMERYNEVPIQLQQNGTVHIPAGIGMTGQVQAYVAWKKGHQKWTPVSGKIAVGGAPTVATRPPTVIEAAGSEAHGKLLALANARFETGRTGRSVLVVDFVLQEPFDGGKRYFLVVEGDGRPVQTDVSLQLRRVQRGEKGRFGISLLPGRDFPAGNLKLHVEQRMSIINRGDSVVVSNSASVRR